MKVIAVVVTYNRAKLLQECINALCEIDRDTLEKIIIIDNNSTEVATRDYLSNIKAENVDIVLLNKNIGGSGGFNIGIRRAVELGSDYVWVMDDDTIPQRDSLAILLDVAKTKDNIGFLASKVLWTDGSDHVMNIPDFFSPLDKNESIRKIRSSSFVSMLINSKVIRKVGLPYKEFFIWGDDSEYSGRITSSGYMGLYVNNSVVLHKTAANYGPDISTAPVSTAWKFYYSTRNQLFVNRRSSGGLFFFIKELNHLRLALHNINKRKPNERLVFRKNVLRGFRDGLSFNPQIEYI